MRSYLIIACGLTVAAASAAMAQSAPRTEDLIGKWGVAAYWSEADAARTIAQAKSFCNQPYVITKGRNGGAMMFEPFDGKPREVKAEGGRIAAADGSAGAVKTVTSWNGSTLVLNYVEDEPKRKYGNMVFVRCGR
ncbi:MAG: hypothetical protein ACKVON_06705 [Beijerinckiaceae bacterium]